MTMAQQMVSFLTIQYAMHDFFSLEFLLPNMPALVKPPPVCN